MLALIPDRAFSSIQLPTGMNKNERLEALRIIGLGTASKILSDPYPLGGYTGFEVGYSLESFPADNLGRLGSRISPPQQNTSLSRITIGKGLYNNIDVFIQFTPYVRQDEISQFGGILRWGFYQAPFLPLSLSVLAHLNNSSIGAQLSTQTRGFNLIGGVDSGNISVFAGAGLAESTGTFIGGPASLTDTRYSETEYVSHFHSVIGGTLKFSNLFVSLQIDRYALPVYSGKLGFHF
jgi:hypothetical protein